MCENSACLTLSCTAKHPFYPGKCVVLARLRGTTWFKYTLLWRQKSKKDQHIMGLEPTTSWLRGGCKTAVLQIFPEMRENPTSTHRSNDVDFQTKSTL